MGTFSIANHDHTTFYPLIKFIASAQVWGTDIGFPASLGVGMIPIPEVVKPEAEIRVAGLSLPTLALVS